MTAAARDGEARAVLGPFSVFMLVVGSVIGSGIFILPGLMAATLPSPLLVAAAFALGGVVTFFGALTYAELGGLFPQEGGQYVYLREGLGRGWGFLHGWTQFFVYVTGVMAALSLAFARFFATLVGATGPWVEPLVALAVIVGLTLVNWLGLRPGALAQNLLTAGKLAGIATLVVAAFLLVPARPGALAPLVPSGVSAWGVAGALAAAGLAGLFAYDGWHAVTYVAAHTRDPRRTVPRGLALGTATVTLVYVVTVLAYFWVLPVETVTGGDASRRIGAVAAQTLLGDAGARFVLVAILVSIVGAVNAVVLAGPRLFHAMAADGLFWSAFARPGRFGAPTMALVFQAEWAALLVIVSRPAVDAYLAIVNAIVFAVWLFHVPTAVAYFRLRRLRPDADRPYRTWGHPFVPALFLAASVSIVGALVALDVARFAAEGLHAGNAAQYASLWGGLLVASGLPFLRRSATARAQAPLPR